VFSAAFGILAALLAAVGLYGLLAYTVAHRTSEIGLRVAIGAGRGDITRLVLGESARLVIIGVVAGMALGGWLTRWTASLLFGLQPWDAMTFSLAPVALLIIGLGAAFVPARRAASIDPATALRTE
jgi:ABC-type antimicrobial peptide transport system permease subunit